MESQIFDGRILVTGAAGFIGAHLVRQLAEQGYEVLALDNFDIYYSPELKKLRCSELWAEAGNIQTLPLDVCDEAVLPFLAEYQIDSIIHFSAQPGVRLPPDRFDKYIQNNTLSLHAVMKVAEKLGIDTLVYASSSSVYGDSQVRPFSEHASPPSPRSYYGATKLAGEVLATSFAERTGLRARGLRLFTVYGPWGRPDMAYFRLVAAALGQWDFVLAGDGTLRRDFTYIDDVVSSVIDLLLELRERPAGFHDVVNVGGGNPRSMSELAYIIGQEAGNPVRWSIGTKLREDPEITHADFTYLRSLVGYSPHVGLEDGVQNVVSWAQLPEVAPRLNEWIRSVRA